MSDERHQADTSSTGDNVFALLGRPDPEWRLAMAELAAEEGATSLDSFIKGYRAGLAAARSLAEAESAATKSAAIVHS